MAYRYVKGQCEGAHSLLQLFSLCGSPLLIDSHGWTLHFRVLSCAVAVTCFTVPVSSVSECHKATLAAEFYRQSMTHWRHPLLLDDRLVKINAGNCR